MWHDREVRRALSMSFESYRTCNVTAHPSAQWNAQQLREALRYETRYEYLLHDRDSIFSADLDESVRRLGLRVLKSRRAARPRMRFVSASSDHSARVFGLADSFFRSHLRRALKMWIAHYNRGRPHMALGPVIPDPPRDTGRRHFADRSHNLRGGLPLLFPMQQRSRAHAFHRT